VHSDPKEMVESKQERVKRYRYRPVLRRGYKTSAEIYEAAGVPVSRVPEDVKPGAPYTTPSDIARSGVFKYSRQRILQLIDEGLVDSHLMGHQRIILEHGMQQLLHLALENDRGAKILY
jgi:hypothetical protein